MDARVTVLNRNNSYLNHLLHELRDKELQLDRLRFRTNLERTGEILGYEISKELSYADRAVETPLGTLDIPLLRQQPVIVSIMRAGLPLHDGLLRLFDHADNGFVSAYRHHTKGNKFIIRIEYTSAPDLTGKTLILADPMIATGRSVVDTYHTLIERGTPDRVFVAGVIASQEGLEHVLSHIAKVRIFVGAVDHELTARGYIVPGLGDAGDLAFGEKV